MTTTATASGQCFDGLGRHTEGENTRSTASARSLLVRSHSHHRRNNSANTPSDSIPARADDQRSIGGSTRPGPEGQLQGHFSTRLRATRRRCDQDTKADNRDERWAARVGASRSRHGVTDDHDPPAISLCTPSEGGATTTRPTDAQRRELYVCIEPRYNGGDGHTALSARVQHQDHRLCDRGDGLDGGHLYAQDLVATGVVRLSKVPTKDTLAEMHTKYLSVDRTRCLPVRHNLNSSVDGHSIHGILSDRSHVKLSRYDYSRRTWFSTHFVVTAMLCYSMPCCLLLCVIARCTCCKPMNLAGQAAAEMLHSELILCTLDVGQIHEGQHLVGGAWGATTGQLRHSEGTTKSCPVWTRICTSGPSFRPTRTLVCLPSLQVWSA